MVSSTFTLEAIYSGDGFVVFFIGEAFLCEKVWRRNFLWRLSPRRWQPAFVFIDAEICIGVGNPMFFMDAFFVGVVSKVISSGVVWRRLQCACVLMSVPLALRVGAKMGCPASDPLRFGVRVSTTQCGPLPSWLKHCRCPRGLCEIHRICSLIDVSTSAV
jgi:hypothetical protein